MSKVCPRCGSPYEGNVCPFCDYEEQAAEAASAPAPQPAPEQPMYQPEQPMYQPEPEPAPAPAPAAPLFDEPVPQPESAVLPEEPAAEVAPVGDQPLEALGEGLGLEAMMGDLSNEFGDLANELAAVDQQSEELEDYDVYAKVFPAWDLLPIKQ